MTMLGLAARYCRCLYLSKYVFSQKNWPADSFQPTGWAKKVIPLVHYITLHERYHLYLNLDLILAASFVIIVKLKYTGSLFLWTVACTKSNLTLHNLTMPEWLTHCVCRNCLNHRLLRSTLVLACLTWRWSCPWPICMALILALVLEFCYS